ncbi:hypothetical protein AC578_4420 [Pseudocercospora eumusae]|uniref:Uncharacterized protein n=1 Tax=Pseudocercospora eumusae TaxID=321146 RepID=A0A139HF67_9PEZI|nr:hypothetical protein AC578_4420 [Pseudocercospora eumusae]KXT01009.1 hypothetical protein AC578_4420 [Pseudocercospora eumusae]
MRSSLAATTTQLRPDSPAILTSLRSHIQGALISVQPRVIEKSRKRPHVGISGLPLVTPALDTITSSTSIGIPENTPYVLLADDAVESSRDIIALLPSMKRHHLCTRRLKCGAIDMGSFLLQ